jgi:acyl-coenzyme A synthetase/AMP-(fatty) acid ligase
MNIVDPILFHCKSIPLAAAICAPGQNMGLISYGRLQQAINNVGQKAVALGLKRGSVVAVMIEDRILDAAITLGLMRIGAVTFQGRTGQILNDLKVEAILTDRTFPGLMPGKKIVVVDRGWMTGDAQPLDKRHYEGSEDDLCRIILTSGTTGESKAVGITHKMMAQRIACHHYVFGNQLSQAMRVHCDFTFGASLGFQFLVYMLWKGGTLFCGGGDIDTTIQTFDLYKVQALLGSPASLAGYTKFYELNKDAHARFELAIVAGSQLHRSLSERARARLCTNVVNVYGATEISVVATAPAHAIADVEGASGHVTPNVTIEIVDENERPVTAGTDGTVRILSPYSVAGYLGSANRSESAFRDGYFYPGDIGHLTKDGLLVITGRAQAIMNIAGDKAKPEAIEAVLATFRGVEDAAVVAVKDEFGMDRVCAAIVGSLIDKKALKAHCEARLASMHVPNRFVFVDKLPRNEMGKLERAAIHALVMKARVE